MKFVKYFDRTTYKKCTGTFNNMESLTDPSFAIDSDINVLVAQMMRGVAPRTPVREPVYDMENYNTASWTFEDWQNEKAKIERKFLHLSPEMKEKFKTPAEFFKYCSNPDNYEITKEGVIEKQDPEPIVAVPQVPGTEGQQE